MTGQEHIAEYIKTLLQARGDRLPSGWVYRGPGDMVNLPLIRGDFTDKEWMA